MCAPQGPSPPHASPHYPMPAPATCASTCIRQAPCQCGAASKAARWQLPPADVVRGRKGSAHSSRGGSRAHPAGADTVAVARHGDKRQGAEAETLRAELELGPPVFDERKAAAR